MSGSWDKTIRVWNLSSGACERILEGHTDRISDLAGDESKDLVVSGSWDTTVRVWQVSTGACLHELRGHTSFVISVALLPGKVIVTGGEFGEIKVWDGEQGAACTKTLTGGGTSTVFSVVSDGKRIFSGDHAGDIHVFDMESGACTEVLFHAPRYVSCLLLSPKGDALVAACFDGKIRAWDLGSDDRTPREFEGKCGLVIHMSWQEGVGPMRVVSGHKYGIRVWDFETGECVFSLNTPPTLGAADLHRLAYLCGSDVKLLDFSA
jgi:WD40 repeat protein